MILFFGGTKKNVRHGTVTGLPRVCAALPAAILLSLVACAPAVQPQPTDTANAQITVLQKQLLELQNLLNENRRKVEEQAILTETLSSKIKAMEERQSLTPESSPPPHRITSKQSATQKPTPEKKKAAKKKKKTTKKTVRRQEQ